MLFLDIVLNNNIELYVKGDQAHTCNLQPRSFQDCIICSNEIIRMLFN